MRPYDKVILLVSVLVSWTVAGMPSAAAGAPGMDIPSMQPRIATLKDKVESLESEYGVRFVYSSDINLERPYIGVRAEAAENAVESGSAEGLEAALDRVFRGTGISWKKHRRYIMLGLEPPIEVRDSIRTMAGTDGIPERTDTIAESRITTDRYIREINRTQTGLTRIDGEKFNRGFAFLSSPDLIKTIQSLPGVAGGTELMSGLYVHGGTGTDNLFLLDGVPLYQVSHLAGLFSSFNTDVVESVDFYKSGFPARYGGRLSSVVDVRTREGDFEEYHGLFSIGLIDGRFQYEGPIVRGKTSFNVAMRRSWLDLIAVPVMGIMNASRNDGIKNSFVYAFWDLNGKVTHRFSDDDILSLNLYYGNDAFMFKSTSGNPGEQIGMDENQTGDDSQKIRFNWGNVTASLDWNRRISEKLDSRVTAYFTRYASRTGIYDIMWDQEGNTAYDRFDERTASNVSDIVLKADFRWTPSRMHRVRFGAAYQYHLFNPGRTSSESYVENGVEQSGTYQETRVRYDGHEPFLYIEDEMTFTDWFSMNAGLRYVLSAVKGKLYQSLEPRAALSFRIIPEAILKLSYTEMSQFSHQISSIYIDLPTSSWLPSTSKIAPMRSRQFSGGLYLSLPYSITVNIEGFYKTMDNLREYSGPTAIFPPLDRWEESFVKGKGKAYGLETEVSWSNEKLDMSAYYTLSWSKRKFDDFYSDWYLDRNDNRHKFTVNAAFRVNSRIDLYAAWNYHTGNRITLPSHRLDYEDVLSSGDRFVYSSPYNAKLPDYHRLDVGVNFRKRTKRGNERIWNLSIYNLYCRPNAITGSANPHYNDNGSDDYQGFATGIIPIIPTFGYTLKF